jgi:hypothetical protein
MSLYGYLPHEYNYALFLADHYDYYPWDSLIRNMVSERYPRNEDDDVASASDSDIGEDEDEESASASSILDSSASHRFVFGSFDSPIVPVSSPSIEPKFDGFSVQIGAISCVFVDSCKNIVDCADSVFVASEEDGYVKDVEPALKNHDSDFVVSEASQELIAALPVRMSSTVYDVAAAKPCALWLFVGKQSEQLASSIKIQLPFLKLHDEPIINFDPGGRTGSFLLFSVFAILRQIRFRLWWIPWDRGKKVLSLFDTHSETPLQKQSDYLFTISIQNSSKSRNKIASFVHQFQRFIIPVSIISDSERVWKSVSIIVKSVLISFRFAFEESSLSCNAKSAFGISCLW